MKLQTQYFFYRRSEGCGKRDVVWKIFYRQRGCVNDFEHCYWVINVKNLKWLPIFFIRFSSLLLLFGFIITFGRSSLAVDECLDPEACNKKQQWDMENCIKNNIKLFNLCNLFGVCPTVFLIHKLNQTFCQIYALSTILGIHRFPTSWA